MIVSSSSSLGVMEAEKEKKLEVSHCHREEDGSSNRSEPPRQLEDVSLNSISNTLNAITNGAEEMKSSSSICNDIDSHSVMPKVLFASMKQENGVKPDKDIQSSLNEYSTTIIEKILERPTSGDVDEKVESCEEDRKASIGELAVCLVAIGVLFLVLQSQKMIINYFPEDVSAMSSDHHFGRSADKQLRPLKKARLSDLQLDMRNESKTLFQLVWSVFANRFLESSAIALSSFAPKPVRSLWRFGVWCVLFPCRLCYKLVSLVLYSALPPQKSDAVESNHL